MREAASDPISPARPPEPIFSLIERHIHGDAEGIADELSYQCELLAAIIGASDSDGFSEKARIAGADLARAVGRGIIELMIVVQRAEEAELRKRIHELPVSALAELLASVSPAFYTELGRRDRNSPDKDQRMQAYYRGYGAAGDRPGRVLGIDLTEPVPEPADRSIPDAVGVATGGRV